MKYYYCYMNDVHTGLGIVDEEGISTFVSYLKKNGYPNTYIYNSSAKSNPIQVIPVRKDKSRARTFYFYMYQLNKLIGVDKYI